MIRFNSASAKDFGGHRSFKHTIKGNVLGLSGVSGAGKSTILQLFELLATGKIDHKNRPINAWVRRSATDDVKKFEASGSLTVDGKPLTITRASSLAGTSTRSLVWDGGKPITAAAAVDDLMTTLFGANMKTVSSLVFIRQGSFGLLFSGLDSDRREFFVRLLALGHLEKVAGVVDTYRKTLMGSVSDLSAVKDQAEEAYRQAQAYFEQEDNAISRMKSYVGEIAAGVELSGVLDKLADAEGKLKIHTDALQAGFAPLSLTLGTYALWATTAETELTRLREALASAVNRRKSRATYETNVSQLKADITGIQIWLDKKAQHDDLSQQLAAMADSADKPDPRLRIARIDTLLAAWDSRQRALSLQPVAQERLLHLSELEVTAGKSYDVAYDAVVLAGGALEKARGDLRDMEALKSATAHAADGQQCKVCGNEHPDPAFLDKAIANTKELALRLAEEDKAKMEARNTAYAALGAVQADIRDAKATAKNIEDQLVEAANVLEGAEPADALRFERHNLEADIPAYDAAKSMSAHLTAQLGAIALGGATYTAADVASKQSDLGLAEQMLGMLPTAEAIEQSERELTEEGVSLKETRDRIAQLFANYEYAERGFKELHDYLNERVASYTTGRPYLISSIGALGPLTPANVTAVLADLREKQSQYDAQTGTVAAANRAMNAADATLKEIETKIEEQKARIIIGKELEAVRAAFMPTGITTDYIAHQFQRIAVVAQDHLAQMSADFMVVASESRALSFDYLRLNESGGAWLDQDSMSGGQQVKLAIAIILAIHELIIPQVGLLVLDEPSTHLDLDSRVALAEVLKEIGRRGNFQLIVCDHSPELKDAYDDTIELSV